LTTLLCIATTVPLCRTWHLLVYAVPQLGIAMAAELDLLSVGQLHTEDGDMIIWQVSVYAINQDNTLMTDWRDVSMVHSCIMEGTYQGQILAVTIAAPHPAPVTGWWTWLGGNWVVDLEQWIQLNTRTKARHHIRRSVITGARSSFRRP